MAIFKILISGILIWLASEFGKRSGKIGGLILSLPLTSIIAICWLWIETKDPTKISSISTETLVFILPSLVFFIVLALMLNKSIHFYLSFSSAIFCTLAAYGIFFKLRGI